MPADSATSTQRKPRVVVAGQIPPPIGGQALMIEQILRELKESGRFEVAHLPFRFTRTAQAARKASFAKVSELVLVVIRLLKIRLQSPIDCTLYPIGGPQLVPILRDILLLPWVLLLSRRVVLHFHAGGIAETLDSFRAPIPAMARWLYRRVDAGIVMTEFGRRDASFIGVSRTEVVPLNFTDKFDPALVVPNPDGPPRLLYVGHWCPEKGTPALLLAVAALRDRGMDCTLDLVGECLAPYTQEELTALIAQLNLADRVTLHGLLSGEEKWRRYAQADLFVFPSVAHESFGIVMAEAMMWRLPVDAGDWRGNREVLNGPPEELLFLTRPDLTENLTAALERAFRERPRWSGWGRANRRSASSVV